MVNDVMEGPEFIAALRLGNQRAWHHLVATWLPKAKFAISRYNLSEDERSEVLQRVLIDFHNGIDNFESINIDAFLTKKAQWRSLDLIRARTRACTRLDLIRARTRLSEDPLDQDFAESDLERDFDEDSSKIELFREALRALSRRERLVVFLFYYNRCSYLRIAEMMKEDYGWVKNTLHRTKVKLKRMTDGRGD